MSAYAANRMTGHSRSRGLWPLCVLALLLCATHVARAEDSGAGAQGRGAHSGSGAESNDATATKGAASSNGSSRAATDQNPTSERGARGATSPRTPPTTRSGAEGQRPGLRQEGHGEKRGGPATDTLTIGIPTRRRTTGSLFKGVIAKPHITSTFRRSPPGVSGPPPRNAIGIVIGQPTFARTTETPRPTTLTPTVTTLSRGTMQGIPPTNGRSTSSSRQTVAIPVLRPQHNAGINGTGMIRIGTGPATIGGPARTTTGINGTSFKPRHGN